MLQDLLYTLILLTVFTVPALLIFFVGRLIVRTVTELRLSKYIAQQVYNIGHPVMQFLREVVKEFDAENDVDELEHELEEQPVSFLGVIKDGLLEGVGRLFSLVFGASMVFFLCVFLNLVKIVKEDAIFYVHIWKYVYTIPDEFVFSQGEFEYAILCLSTVIVSIVFFPAIYRVSKRRLKERDDVKRLGQ